MSLKDLNKRDYSELSEDDSLLFYNGTENVRVGLNTFSDKFINEEVRLSQYLTDLIINGESSSTYQNAEYMKKLYDSDIGWSSDISKELLNKWAKLNGLPEFNGGGIKYSGNSILASTSLHQPMDITLYGKSVHDDYLLGHISGTSIHVEDSADAKIQKMEVHSKNLWKYESEISGVGVVANRNYNIQLKKGRKYYFSAEVETSDTDATNCIVLITLYKNDNTKLSWNLNLTRGDRAISTAKIFDDDVKLQYVYFYASINANYSKDDEFTFKNIMISEIDDMTYEPYQKDVDVTVYGKNLFNQSAELEKKGAYYALPIEDLIIGKSYCLSWENTVKRISSEWVYINENADATFMNQLLGTDAIANRRVVFNATSEKMFLIAYRANAYESEQVFLNAFGNFILEFGSSSSDYEPYIEPQKATIDTETQTGWEHLSMYDSTTNIISTQSANINLYYRKQDGTVKSDTDIDYPVPFYPREIISVGKNGKVGIKSYSGNLFDVNTEPFDKSYRNFISTIQLTTPLRAIQVSTGGNYTDESGQQWIADTLEYRADGSGKMIRRIKEVDLGSVSFAYYEEDDYFYSTTLSDKASGNYNILCSNYKVTSVASAASIKHGEIKGHDSKCNIYIKDTRCKTLDAFYTVKTGVILFYELRTPTITELTPEQVSEFEKIHSYSPTTYIETDDIGDIETTFYRPYYKA